MTLPSKIPNNSSCLLIGPPLSGEKEFLYKFMEDSAKNNIPLIFIATDKAPELIKKELVQQKIFITKHETDGKLKYIDCYSHHTEEFLKDNDAIKRVPGPLAFNEISVALSDIEQEFFKTSEKHRIIFNSLSTLLMYSNPQTVSRFLQILIAKIKKAGGTILFTLEEGMHDPKVIVTVEHLMDAIIHIQKNDTGQIVIRADGIPELTTWTALE